MLDISLHLVNQNVRCVYAWVICEREKKNGFTFLNMLFAVEIKGKKKHKNFSVVSITYAHAEDNNNRDMLAAAAAAAL